MQFPYECRNTYIYIGKSNYITCQGFEKMQKILYLHVLMACTRHTQNSAWKCCLCFSVVCFPRFRARRSSVPWSKVAISGMVVVQPCPNRPIKHRSPQELSVPSKLAKHGDSHPIFNRKSFPAWWFPPIRTIWVKLEIFPNFRGKINKKLKPPFVYLPTFGPEFLWDRWSGKYTVRPMVVTMCPENIRSLFVTSYNGFNYKISKSLKDWFFPGQEAILAASNLPQSHGVSWTHQLLGWKNPGTATASRKYWLLHWHPGFHGFWNNPNITG